MTYKVIEDLPEYIRKFLSLDAQQYFLEVYMSAYKNYDEQVSFQIAWELTKSKFQKVGNTYVINNYVNSEPEEDEEVTAFSEAFSFAMKEPEVKVVMNSNTEEIIMEAILATTDKNTEGKYFTEEGLASIAEQINTLGSTLPDVNHAKLIELCKTYGNDTERIRAELKKEKGLFKNIKAVVDNGKLWIQAVLDKRYKTLVKKFNGLSIEAVADKGENGKLLNPKYMGFTFTNTPKLSAARIAA